MPILPIDGIDPDIDDEAWVAPTASIIGRVTMHAQSSAFYGAVLRGDIDTITIGPRTNLQDNVVVHTDAGHPAVIGADVSVGHLALLHGCVVEDGCLIGMSATVLSGAVVGAQSLVAAGAVVLEGQVIPPRSLVAGVPAKVRRGLTEDELERLRLNAEHYVETSAKHRRIGEVSEASAE